MEARPRARFWLTLAAGAGAGVSAAQEGGIVEPGVHTYYLNTSQVQGGGNDTFLHGSLLATFHPN